MDKQNDLLDGWKNFVNSFNTINSLYRRGRFEQYVYQTKLGYKEKSLRRGSKAIQLKIAANDLFENAKRAWEAEKGIPFEHFPKIIKSIPLSFELDEYYLNVESNKKAFFLNFNREFLFPEVQNEREFFITKVENIGEAKIVDFPSKSSEISRENFLKLAKELLLFSLAGISVKYFEHNPQSYEEGAYQTEKILRYLEFYSSMRRTLEKNDHNSYISTLTGLANFFKGRFAFGTGQFQKAEEAFKESNAIYLQKMNSLISGSYDEKEFSGDRNESFSLAMRRANLAEVIGLVNLYIAESRIEEALNILNRTRPLLKVNSGKIMLAYCNLREASAIRAKFSSSDEKLKKCEESVQNCFKVFNDLIPNTHFCEQANIEMSLIHFYRAENLSPENIIKRKNLYNKAEENLDDAIKYATKEKDGKPKNRRIAAEAYPLRSRIHRYYAKIESASFLTHIDSAIKDAENAINMAAGLGQLEAEAHIALGTAKLDFYEWSVEKLKKADSAEARQETQSDGESIRKESSDAFFKGIECNKNNNQRINALCFLGLCKLETLRTTNYVRAKYFYDKYKSLKKIDHKYVLSLAEELEQVFKERPSFEFDIDPDETLNFNYWKSELHNYLVRQTIFRVVEENKAILPSDQTTKQLLANAFKDRMGLSQRPAYELAGDINIVNEFEKLRTLFNKKPVQTPSSKYVSERTKELEVEIEKINQQMRVKTIHNFPNNESYEVWMQKRGKKISKLEEEVKTLKGLEAFLQEEK